MEKALPNSKLSEAYVLGAILINADILDNVTQFLKPEHFYGDTHRLVYEALLHVYHSQEVPDIISVSDHLEITGKLQKIGGASFLNSLTENSFGSHSAFTHAQKIVWYWKLRQTIWISGQMAAMAYEGDESAISFGEEELFRIEQEKRGQNILSHRSALNKYMETILEMHDSRGLMSGIPTGYKQLTKKLGPFRASKLYILAGRPGTGKTALMLCMAYEAAKLGCQILIFSIEMDEEELMQRLISMEAGIDSTHLRDGTLSDEPDAEGKTEWDRVLEAKERLEKLPGTIWIDPTPANDIQSMQAKLRKAQFDHGIDFVIVDYLQLTEVGVADSRKAENRRLEVEMVSRAFKQMARQYKVPFLALAQINRNSENRADRRPQLSDLREAGGIEQDCDAAMFLYREPTLPEDAPEYPVLLLIEKNRSGPKGIIPLMYKSYLTRFYPMQPPQIEEEPS